MTMVIFDCDGVLVDSEVLACEVEAAFLTEEGLPTRVRDVMERYLGRSEAFMLADVQKRLGKPLPADFAQRLDVRLNAEFESRLTAIPGIARVIADLTVPRCVASSSRPERIRRSLGLTGLLASLEPHIFSTTMVENGKPAPDLFLHAAERMEIDPRTCLVVEDSPAGVLAGKAAGMTVVGFLGGAHRNPEDDSLLRDAGADLIAEDSAALGGLIQRTI